jgi:hypothetical protein
MMRTNPGGQLDSSDVVGRDALIAKLWDILDRQSLLLTAERRIGKTTVIKKMRDAPRPGFLCFYQDLEGVHSVLEFIDEVFRVVRDELTKRQKAMVKAQRIWQTIGGTQLMDMVTLPPAALPQWKEILRSVVADLISNHEGNVVFLWDELPQMLLNIRRASPSDAMALLDVLRSLRQEYGKNLRMVYTGSIGLHSVIDSLRRDGYGNAPVNDMFELAVPRLQREDALKLSVELIRGESIQAANEMAVAAAIVDAVERHPFYLQHVVRRLQDSQPPVTPDLIPSVVDTLIADTSDPFEFQHYRTRIDRDYEGNDAKAALMILDALAAAEASLSFELLAKSASVIPGLDEREAQLRVLKLLQQDHYVIKNSDSSYSFMIPLLRRWWKADRNL